MITRQEKIKKILKMEKWDYSKPLDFICWDKKEEIFYIYLGNGKRISDDSVDLLLSKYYFWLKKNREKFNINW